MIWEERGESTIAAVELSAISLTKQSPDVCVGDWNGVVCMKSINLYMEVHSILMLSRA